MTTFMLSILSDVIYRVHKREGEYRILCILLCKCIADKYNTTQATLQPRLLGIYWSTILMQPLVVCSHLTQPLKCIYYL